MVIISSWFRDWSRIFSISVSPPKKKFSIPKLHTLEEFMKKATLRGHHIGVTELILSPCKNSSNLQLEAVLRVLKVKDCKLQSWASRLREITPQPATFQVASLDLSGWTHPATNTKRNAIPPTSTGGRMRSGLNFSAKNRKPPAATAAKYSVRRPRLSMSGTALKHLPVLGPGARRCPPDKALSCSERAPGKDQGQHGMVVSSV